ncbi:MAG: GNAT family N-acetyltransferase [Candidatus Ratteibacteria bacterium]
MEIKNPEKIDYEKILRFLEDVYGHCHNYFPIAYPHVCEKENVDYKNILIIEENNKICSLVRIFPIETIQNGVKVKFGGIGSVSTDYEERGKGYMTILMNEAIKKMEKENYPLSILWGDRHRYINFGYENGGKIITLFITNRGFEKTKITKAKAKRYLGEKDVLEKIIENYNKKNYRIERDYEYFKQIYKKLKTATYYSEENKKFAYVVIDEAGPETKVYEYGGDDELILKILKYIADRFGKTKFLIDFPDFSDIPEIILKATSYWQIFPAGMIKIVSLKKTVETFIKLIEKSVEEGEELNFEIEGKEKVGIKKENGKIKFVNGNKNIIKLKEEEMVRLFFNISDIGVKLKEDLKEKIRKFLPINIFFPILDHI